MDTTDTPYASVAPGVVSFRYTVVPAVGTGVGDTSVALEVTQDWKPTGHSDVPVKKLEQADVEGDLHGPEPEEQEAHAVTGGMVPLLKLHATVPSGQYVVLTSYA